MKKASDGQTDWWPNSDVQYAQVGNIGISGYRYTNETAEVAWLIATCHGGGVHTCWYRSAQFFDIQTIIDDSVPATIPYWRFKADLCKVSMPDSEVAAIQLAISDWEKAEPSRDLDRSTLAGEDRAMQGEYGIPMLQVFQKGGLTSTRPNPCNIR